MSLSARSRERPVPTMNVTPLVDVVLVLLIIFMVVVPMMESNAQIRLPDFLNPDAEAKSKTDPYVLSITRDGQVYFEKQQVDEKALAVTLRKANRNDPSRRIVLRADQDTPYAVVRPLFKTCQTIGFPGVSIRVNALTKKGS